MTGMLRSMGRDHLRIVRPDGRGGDDDVGVADMGGVVAAVDRGAQVVQTLGDVGGAEVRTADLIAQIEEDLGDPAHADAADPDEMDAPDLPVHAALLKGLFHLFPQMGPAGRRSSDQRQTGIDDVLRRVSVAQGGGGGFHFPDGLRIAVEPFDQPPPAAGPLRSFSAIISAAPARARTSAFCV